MKGRKKRGKRDVFQEEKVSMIKRTHDRIIGYKGNQSRFKKSIRFHSDTWKGRVGFSVVSEIQLKSHRWKTNGGRINGSSVNE